MPEVLRHNAAPVAKVCLSHYGLAPDEINVVRKLVGHSVAVVECGLICETLAWRGGNRTHAANVLGISVRTLRNKVHSYKRLGISLSEPSRSLIDGRGGATTACSDGRAH
jgi:DNA-binding protein Fis